MKLLIQGEGEMVETMLANIPKTDVGIQTEETAYPGQDVQHDDYEHH